MSLAPVPRLDDLLADPAKARDLRPEVARATLLQLAPLVEALRLQALTAPAGGNGQDQSQANGDRLLDIQATAAKLGTSTDWLYRRAAKLPFTVRLGSRLRFSERGIERWLRQRQGR